MSKTVENLKCGNYEVVDNRGVSVTRHFTQCLEKEFADLEAKLAEKDKEINNLKELRKIEINYKKELRENQLQEIIKLEQQLAIYKRALELENEERFKNIDSIWMIEDDNKQILSILPKNYQLFFRPSERKTRERRGIMSKKEIVNIHKTPDGIWEFETFEKPLRTQIAELKQQLAEKERQYETLYKLFSKQHEIIDQNELECFEEVNRLLKEQKDFYIVEKAEYDKMKQGAKDIVKDLKQKLEEKDQDKISFAVKPLEKVKELMRSIDMPNKPELYNNDMFGAGFDSHYIRVEKLIDNQINKLKRKEK